MKKFNIQKILAPLYDKHHTKQLKSFFLWLHKQGLPSNTLIQIHLPFLKYYCDPFRNIVSTINTPQFVLCTPNTKPETLGYFEMVNFNNWHNIFSSQYFEVWENKAFYENKKQPIRFGLTEAEKVEALNLARSTVTNYLNGHCKETEENQDFFDCRDKNELVNVDVAIWADGQLRGSQIIFNTPLVKGIIDASIRAIGDDRFKPIQQYEISKLKIEITLMSSLKIPLFKHELDKNEIYAEKGYEAISTKGRGGWFVPAVFNCISFSNLADLLSRLSSEKIRLSPGESIQEVSIFEVEDFIESDLSDKPLPLKGPVTLDVNNEEITNYEIIKKMAEQSLVFLENSQEADGNIIPITDPQTGKNSQIDWVRLAFTTYALSYYGNAVESDLSLRIARNSYKFIEKNFLNLERQRPYIKCLTYIYISRAEILLYSNERRNKFSLKIAPLLNTLPFEPILYSQYALYLTESNPNNKSNQDEASKCLEVILQNFELQKESNPKISLASYPELIFLLKTFGGEKNLAKAQEILNWYLKQQMSDGSFPTYPSSNFSYTRGTAKVLEVLVRHVDEMGEATRRALCWLNSMQYQAKNTYFIKSENRTKINGGFRHDYFNQSSWIDANGHFLIAAANFEKLYKD